MPRVYVGRLSYHVREKDIQKFFSGYGKLLEIDLKNGYGFVEFEDTRDADDAVYELNGKDLCGERVIVEHARGPRRDRDGYGGGGGRSSGYSSRSRSGRDKYGPPVRTEYRLIVENLSSRCSWQDLKDFMRQAGEVTYADAHKERTNEGVIEFRSHSDMKRAIDKLDGTDINGRKIRLVEDRPHRQRSYSGSRSRLSSLSGLVAVDALAAGAAGARVPVATPDRAPGPDPGARGDLVLGGSPDPSLLPASPDPTPGNLVLTPAGHAATRRATSLARARMPESLAPSPAPSPSRCLRVAPRRSRSAKSPAAARRRPWRTGKRSVPSPPPAPPLHETISTTRRLNTQPPHRRHVQSLFLAPGLIKPIPLLTLTQTGGGSHKSIWLPVSATDVQNIPGYVRYAGC
ncbi:serine and arginine rich splicing factor 6b isoform X1 [Alosa sapidissima]|uniref:serine and arginine rich splicing factor 6b isoform X1 n=1 Tax=Alosa sapidissima TaxID=34773 RepID=UPI001C09AEEC|nr:serine and arginine rich splicing factor 6b isoform X1 [Alosa sapidissima]